MTPTICIVHFNTPALTAAEVKSIRLHCGEEWRIVICENSDVEPFTKGSGKTAAYGELPKDGEWPDITIIDNTRQQLVNFDEEIRRHPRRRTDKSCYGRSVFGSVKHSMSVEWLVQNMPGPFILADSDILVKAPLDELWDVGATAAGTIEKEWGFGVERLLPFLCYINAPECRRLGIHYFDPSRTWGLNSGTTERENWYDTGASFLEDIRRCEGATFKRVVISYLMIHLGGASYVRTRDIPEWLYAHRNLFDPDYQYQGKKTIISTLKMDNVKVMTQDGRQYRLTADEGYLLRAKDTGDVVRTCNTLNLGRWEVIQDPDARKDEQPKGSKKKAGRKRKA